MSARWAWWTNDFAAAADCKLSYSIVLIPENSDVYHILPIFFGRASKKNKKIFGRAYKAILQ
jgi:hypothetical protein